MYTHVNRKVTQNKIVEGTMAPDMSTTNIGTVQKIYSVNMHRRCMGAGAGGLWTSTSSYICRCKVTVRETREEVPAGQEIQEFCSHCTH